MSDAVVDALFFDFDGTLGNTQNGIKKAWERTIAEENLDRADFDKYFRVGPPADMMAKIFFPDADEQLQQKMAARYKFNYDNGNMDGEAPYPWAEDILKHFYDAGKKIYVVTYKRLKSTLALTLHYKFEKYISGLWCCDVIPGQNLPKGELLKLAIRVSGAAPERCVMIGDTELDILAGHEAGVHTCAVSWGYAELERLQSAKPEILVNENNFLSEFKRVFGC